MMDVFKNKKIALCVCGSISAYKSVDLASKWVQQGADVKVLMTKSAQKFIGKATFEGITHNKVIDDLWNNESDLNIDHLDIAKNSDLIIVSPITALPPKSINLSAMRPISGLATNPELGSDRPHSRPIDNLDTETFSRLIFEIFLVLLELYFHQINNDLIIKIEKSNDKFLKRVSIQSDELNLSINIMNCKFDEINKKVDGLIEIIIIKKLIHNFQKN